MSPLPTLDQRALDVLRQERKNLQHTYEECAKMFGPIICPNGALALEHINEAIEAISKEIDTPRD